MNNNVNNLESQLLWNNPQVILNKKTIIWKHWIRKNIWRLGDITDDNGEFINLTVLKKNYNLKTNFLEYLSLKKSIP